MKGKTGTAIFGLLIAAVLGIGIASVSSIAANTSPSDDTSSIGVADVHEGDAKVLESEESAQLAHLAKITPEDAKAIALKKVGGEIKKVELDDENGNVVYSVEMIKDQKELDVKVDAGNGKILSIDAGTDNETESELNHADTDNVEHEFEGIEE